MASPGFRKGVGIYFLILALPGIGVALWGESFFWSFVHLPNHDDPDDPGGGINYTRLWEGFGGLATLLILGVALVPGYCCQVFRPSSVSQWFWPVSAAYNLLLVLLYGSCAYSMGVPPFIDASTVIAIAIAFGLPLLNLCLSLTCAVKQRPSLP
jgi:hypothetical protein